MKSGYKTLYLFDIDGTMVDMMPVHVRAYQEAYKKVMGFRPEGKVVARQLGNVERRIHQALLRHYGAGGKRKVPEIIREYTKAAVRATRTARIKILPGVKQLLKQLQSEKQPLGVVTGNNRKIGEAILKKTGLHGYFKVYSYGAVNKRAHIAKRAIATAKRKRIKFGKVVVIGDAPFDVQAAKENKAIAVGVATGKYSYGELRKEKPNILLKSLKNRKKLINSRQ